VSRPGQWWEPSGERTPPGDSSNHLDPSEQETAHISVPPSSPPAAPGDPADANTVPIKAAPRTGQAPLAQRSGGNISLPGALANLAERLGLRRGGGPDSPGTTRTMRLVIVGLVLFALLSLGIGGAVNAVTQVQQMRLYAHDGLRHLEDARALVNFNHLDQSLTPSTLTRAQDDLTAAEYDFALLRQMLADPQGTLGIGAHLPVSGSILASAAHLAAAADEISMAGVAFITDGQLVLNVMKGGLFASQTAKAGNGSSPPGFDMAVFNQLKSGLATGISHLESAVAYAQETDFSVLPSSLVKPQQVAEVQGLLAKWPQIQSAIGKVNAGLDLLPSLLGLNGPNRYLVELMDSTEMRPGGGFIGNYAVITLLNGKIQPIMVRDIALLDAPYLQQHGGTLLAPSQYPWWPYKTIFGLRDSNLSGNFPTSARLGLQQLTAEGGPTAQGVIALTPAVIEGVIHLLGPIPVPQYGRVVTDSNLEYLIHLYELTPSERPLAPLPPSEQLSSPAKRFTALLGQALLAKVRALSLAEQIKMGKQLIGDLHTKDVQVYLTDAKAEAMLSGFQLAGAFPPAGDDGVSFVDANVTGNKGSAYMTVTMVDSVVLDSQGTATHHLTVTYNWNVTDTTQLYGPFYYWTYPRIYAPKSAHLLSIQGFTNLYGYDQINHSDEPGYQMWGGFLIIHDKVPHTLQLTWQVPHAAKRGANGQFAYALEYTRQAALHEVLTTTITVSGASRPVYKYSGHLTGDKVIALAYHA